MILVWLDYLKVNGWESKYESVNNLLRYLRVEKSRSISSRNNYCHSVTSFCRRLNKNPDELTHLEKEFLEREVKGFLDSYSSSRTSNTIKEGLKTFFRVNGRRDLVFPSYYQPSRGGRTRPEYIPTLEEAWKMADCAGSLKSRTIVMFLFTSGLRNSTLRALKYGSILTKDLRLQKYSIRNELEGGKENLAIIIDEGMKEDVPAACKNRIPYFVFIPKETTETLKNYLKERERKNGRINNQEFLFPSSQRGLSSDEKVYKPISNTAVGKIVREAARRAGLEYWKYVTPHCLRKTFMMILINQPEGSRLDEADREFFMGHILKGSQEAYFVRERVEEMRKKFSKLKFIPNAPHDGEQFTRKFAKLYGIDYELVVQEAEKRSGREPNENEIMTVLKEFIENGKKKERKIIDESELTKYLDDGWDPEHILPSGKIVVCKSSI